ncbi:putative phosphatase regulatory subunit-domain-containing protein [Ilyonectria destructans]|nr:putative phosphatase regulatory subunit-domain-containing protein [Ilyonectria destructans]
MASVRKSDFSDVERTVQDLTAARLEKARVELEAFGKTTDPAVNRLLRSLWLYGYRQPMSRESRLAMRRKIKSFIPPSEAPLAISYPLSSAVFFHREVSIFFEHYVRPEHPMSRDVQSSPNQWEMVTPNFPQQTRSREFQFVYRKKLQLLDDQKSFQGLVAVRNVAFHKSVTCRFTFDNWRTTSDVAAAYSDGNASDEAQSGYDFFVFTIQLSDMLNLESKIAQLCVCYMVNGQEYSDNNSGRNFQVCFVKKTLQQDDNILAQGVPLHSRNGLSKNITPTKPTSSPFRGLDFAKCYNISASLDATVRAAKRKLPETTARGPSTLQLAVSS